MPDTMLPTEPAAPPASCGVMDGYRSPGIGALVAARAKASAKIKAIVKDKKARVDSRKEGGRGYEYAYADLADVLDAVEDAISEQGLAIFQATQDRGRDGTFLVTTLAHESDQWIAADIRLKSADAGPQVYGSEMTYLRRYAVLSILALAPEADDDGKTAQDRTDQQQQQARQRPAQRAERPARPETTLPPERVRRTPSAPDEPVHTPIPKDREGFPMVEPWAKRQGEVLAEKPEWWRRGWLVLHSVELDTVRHLKPRWADRLESLAVAPDKPEKPADTIAEVAE